MSETIVEIVAPDGNVHYRRPPGHPDIAEALKTEGYSTREVTPMAKPERPKKPKITPAQMRVMKKGQKPGGVKMAGAFGPDRLAKPHEDEDFDTKGMIEACLKRGWVYWGEGHGTYVTTEKGVQAMNDLGAYQDAMDAYRRNLKLWRAQQKKPRAAKGA